ncbi:MAG: hypothetical protein QOE70_4109 [Chthoniobacter sp.]|jgi:predicted alpha-1,6-mannanase (GH76 family)|nr:hypothetical protein [Chthoniobacter sp.]
MRSLLLLVCTLLVSRTLSPGAESAAPDALAREALVGRVRAGIGLLNQLYWSPTLNIWLDRPGDDLRAHYEGRRNPPWWPSANAVEVLLDFMNATGTSEYQASIEALYDLQKDLLKRTARVVAELKRRQQWNDADEQAWQHRQQKAAPAPSARAEYYSDFQNEYLDDSGWWALAWLKMYDRTRAPKYLETARFIHAHMAKNWKPEKGGGVMWSEDEDKQKPNAITNGLFLVLSARLYQRTHEPSYLKWAGQTLDWFHLQALYDGTGVVDAPGHRGDYWSYNQGVFIGGLTALYQSTGDEKYLAEAVQTADSVLHRAGFTLPNGVITEKLGTQGDASLFKGVLVRYLAQLRDVLQAHKLHPELAQELDRCLRSSATSLLEYSVGADGLFTAEWHAEAKDRKTGFNSQVSALAALIAALDSPR